MKKRAKPSKNESFSPISIEISLVRQEEFEPPTFGSGGQALASSHQEVRGENKFM